MKTASSQFDNVSRPERQSKNVSVIEKKKSLQCEASRPRSKPFASSSGHDARPSDDACPGDADAFTEFLPWKVIEKRIGKTRSTVFRWIRKGSFPPSVKLGPNSVAWRRSDFDDWAADPAAWAQKNQTPAEEMRP